MVMMVTGMMFSMISPVHKQMTRMTQTSAVNRGSIIRALQGASRLSGPKISHCCVDSRG
jgi:hypothetical protein